MNTLYKALATMMVMMGILGAASTGFAQAALEGNWDLSQLPQIQNTAARPQASAKKTRVVHKPITSWTENTTAIDGHLGLGTPQGTFGISLTETFDEQFALSGSLGMGFVGIQASVMPRLQLTGESWALGVGAGATVSQYDQDLRSTTSLNLFGYCGPTYDADAVLWGNAEIFYTYQERFSGLRISTYLGLSRPIAAHNIVLIDQGDTYTIPTDFGADDLINGDVLPYAGLSIGKAF